jgi:hypothetical protein
LLRLYKQKYFAEYIFSSICNLDPSLEKINPVSQHIKEAYKIVLTSILNIPETKRDDKQFRTAQ